MSFEKLSTIEIKKLAEYFGITKNVHKEELIALLKETLSQQALTAVYLQIDSMPLNLLDKYVQSLLDSRSYLLGEQGSTQARWRGDLVWLPLKKLALFSELTSFDDTALSILLLLIETSPFLKRKMQMDPILEHIQGKAIGSLAGILGVEEELEFHFSCYDILQKSRFEAPQNMKSQNWARLLIKEVLGLQLTETEELLLSVISLFQGDELSHVVQALQLLESLFSLSDIAQFFGFAFSDIFDEEQEVNLSKGENSPLLEWMAWIKGDPRIAGYVLLWFLGIVYEQAPETLRFKSDHFTFSFAAEFDDLETCFQQGYFSESEPPLLWNNYQFTSIPCSFFQIGNIHSLAFSKEMDIIPTEIFCLPNLKAIAFGKLLRKIKLTEVDGLEDSPVELLILESSRHHTFSVPEFVWKLPKLKKMLVRGVSAFLPPQNPLLDIGIEELKIFLHQRSFTLNLERLQNLRRIEINSEKRKLDWNWRLPNLERLKLSDAGTITLKEQPFLKEISLRSVEILSMEELPSLEVFKLGFLGGSRADKLITKQIFERLQRAKHLRFLEFGSNSTEWPQKALVWECLESLEISRWQGLLSMPLEISMPNLSQLICNPHQVNLPNLPKSIEHLRVVNLSTHLRTRFSRGLKNFPNLKALELIDVMDEISEDVWEDILGCASLKHLRIEGSKMRRLPLNIGDLQSLETIALYRTGAQVFQTIFYSAPQLKRIEVQELRGTEIFES